MTRNEMIELMRDTLRSDDDAGACTDWLPRLLDVIEPLIIAEARRKDWEAGIWAGACVRNYGEINALITKGPPG